MDTHMYADVSVRMHVMSNLIQYGQTNIQKKITESFKDFDEENTWRFELALIFPEIKN